jgi:hypothetical protein
MFDSSQNIPINLITPEGDKAVTVRFPTDNELSERVQRMKTVVRSLGRGKSVTEPQANEKNDLDLFHKLFVEGSELDEYEASNLISRLTRCKVSDSRREGNQFTVALTVPGANTTHTLRIPSAKQVQQYSRQVVSVIEGRHGLQEMKLNLGASGDLYDALLISSEGYAGGVPISHKSEVVAEVIALLNQDQDDSEVEGF